MMKPQKSRISDAELARLWVAKEPAAAIAERAGVTRAAISKRAKTLGLTPRFGGIQQRKKVRIHCHSCGQIYLAPAVPPIMQHACRKVA